MNIQIRPDDIEMTLNIDGGVLTITDVDAGTTIDVFFSESDMAYLKKRLNEWSPSPEITEWKCSECGKEINEHDYIYDGKCSDCRNKKG